MNHLYENKLNRRGPNQSKVLMNLTLDNQTFKILVKTSFPYEMNFYPDSRDMITLYTINFINIM